MQDSLTPKQSLRIHKEENRVYYHPEVGFYTVKWYDTGNNEIPTVYPIKIEASMELPVKVNDHHTPDLSGW